MAFDKSEGRPRGSIALKLRHGSLSPLGEEVPREGSVSAADLNDITGLDSLEGQGKGRKVLPEVFKAIRE